MNTIKLTDQEVQAMRGMLDLAYWDAKVTNRVVPAKLDKVIDVQEVRAPTINEQGVLENSVVTPAEFHMEETEPEQVIERIHEPARKFLEKVGTEYDPTTLAGQAKHITDKRHLSPYPNPEKFTEETRPAIGSWVQSGVEMDELLFLYIRQLADRIAALEGAPISMAPTRLMSQPKGKKAA